MKVGGRASNVYSAVRIMVGVGVTLHCSLTGFGNHPGGTPLGITVKSSSERMNYWWLHVLVARTDVKGRKRRVGYQPPSLSSS